MIARFHGIVSTEGRPNRAVVARGESHNSNGRFYENSTGILGMTPSRIRAGGADEEIRFAVAQCSLGVILVASSRKGVVSILIDDDPTRWFVPCRIGSPRRV